MKDLLYKEFKLSIHPTVYLFLLLDALLLIPAYPYYVAFIYTCLAVFFVFLSGRENKDVFYTVSLPVRKRDAVRARCWMMAIIEVAQIVFAVPFAFLSNAINRKGNVVGIDADVAFFGFVFIMFAVFNVVFIPVFYKTAYKAGTALILAGSAMSVYIVGIEVAVQMIPLLKANLDTVSPSKLAVQLPVLAAGILIFALTMLFACRNAEKSFEKVDI